MALRSRRRYLIAVLGAGAVALSGCLAGDDNDAPAFLVTDTAFRIREDSGDMVVQVTIENMAPERRRSPLEVLVRYEPADGDHVEWQETETIELASGTEMQRHFQFEGVYEPGVDVDDYVIEAQLVDGDEPNG